MAKELAAGEFTIDFDPAAAGILEKVSNLLPCAAPAEISQLNDNLHEVVSTPNGTAATPSSAACSARTSYAWISLISRGSS
jgi:hypothetical protein